MKEVGLPEVETYISSHYNKVAQLIATRTIINMYLAAEQIMGSRVAKRWWEKYGLDLEGMKTAAPEAERREGGEETYGTETYME